MFIIICTVNFLYLYLSFAHFEKKKNLFYRYSVGILFCIVSAEHKSPKNVKYIYLYFLQRHLCPSF